MHLYMKREKKAELFLLSYLDVDDNEMRKMKL
jgi:hypothetical protein